MLFISTVWMLLQSQAIKLVAVSASLVWKRICKIGISAANEKMFNIAERILNTTLRIKYFLYGGTNRLSTLRNSFIF
jgi:hypothetical protein